MTEAKTMEITKTLLKKKFEDFNLEYFDNEVCNCDFRVINTDSYLGRLIDEDVIRPVLCVAKTDFYNNEIGWEEGRLDNTILHEMIHALIYTRHGVTPNIGCHGIRFRALSWRVFLTHGVWIGTGGVFGLIERKWSSLNRLEKTERVLLTPINGLLMFVL